MRHLYYNMFVICLSDNTDQKMAKENVDDNSFHDYGTFGFYEKIR